MICERWHAFRQNPPGEILPSADTFDAAIAGPNHRFVRVFRYLDGLCCGESRYRFDRLVCVHLVLLAALNGYGYEYQKTNRKQLEAVARKIEHWRVLANLTTMVRALRLDRNASFADLVRAVERVASERRPRDALVVTKT